MKQIIELLCLFCKPAVDTENIYDVPSSLLRKIPDHTLGTLFVSLSVCISFSDFALMCSLYVWSFQLRGAADWGGPLEDMRPGAMETCAFLSVEGSGPGLRPDKCNKAVHTWRLICSSTRHTYLEAMYNFNWNDSSSVVFNPTVQQGFQACRLDTYCHLGSELPPFSECVDISCSGRYQFMGSRFKHLLWALLIVINSLSAYCSSLHVKINTRLKSGFQLNGTASIFSHEGKKIQLTWLFWTEQT